MRDRDPDSKTGRCAMDVVYRQEKTTTNDIQTKQHNITNRATFFNSFVLHKTVQAIFPEVQQLEELN